MKQFKNIFNRFIGTTGLKYVLNELDFSVMCISIVLFYINTGLDREILLSIFGFSSLSLIYHFCYKNFILDKRYGGFSSTTIHLACVLFLNFIVKLTSYYSIFVIITHCFLTCLYLTYKYEGLKTSGNNFEPYNVLRKAIRCLLLLNNYLTKVRTILKSFVQCFNMLPTSAQMAIPVHIFLFWFSPGNIVVLTLIFYVCIFLANSPALFRSYCGKNLLEVVFPPCEHIMITTLALRGAESANQKVLIMLQSIKNVWKIDSIGLEIYKLAGAHKASLSDFFSMFGFKYTTDESVEAQASLEDFDSFLTNWEGLRESPGAKHIRRIYHILLVTNLFSFVGISFEKQGFTKLEEELIKKQNDFGKEGFLLYILRALHFIADQGYNIYTTKSFDGLFFQNNKHRRWYRNYQWLVSHAICAKTNSTSGGSDSPDGEPYSKHYYLALLADTIEDAVHLEKYFSVNDKRMLVQHNQYVTQLLSIQSDIKSRTNVSTDREMPMSMLLNGGPGVGKSMLVDILFSHFAKVNIAGIKNVLPASDDYMYVRNYSAKYWDGFGSHMWCVVLDDIGFMRPEIAKGGGDPSVMELQQIINVVPFTPDQAALENKGRIPLLAELVIGTTNTKELNARQYMTAPTAVLRRFPIVITAQVKQHLRKDNSNEIDMEKVSSWDCVGDCPNYWHFIVERTGVECTGQANVFDGSEASNHEIKYTEILRTDNINDVLKLYHTLILAHYNKRVKVNESKFKLSHVQPSQCCGSIVGCNCQIGLQADAPRLSPLIHSLQEAWYAEKLQLITGYENLKDSIIVKLSIITTFLYVCIRVCEFWFGSYEEPQGAKMPKPRGEEICNIYHSDIVPVTPYDISNNSRCERYDDVVNKVHSNVVNLRFQNVDGSYVQTRALSTGGDCVIFTAHSLQGVFPGAVLYYFISSNTRLSPNSQVKFEHSMVKSTGDIAVMRIIGMPPRKSIVQYFPESNNFHYFGRGELLTRSWDDYVVGNIDVSIINQATSVVSDITIQGPIYTTTKKVASGTCGSPLLVKVKNGAVLYGIHCAGTKNPSVDEGKPGECKAYAHMLTRGIVQELISSLGDFGTTSADFRELSLQNEHVVIKPIHTKSVLSFIEEGQIVVYGSLPNHRTSRRSEVSAHLLQNEFCKYGYTVQHFAPDLRSYKAWRLAMMNSITPVTNFSQKSIDVCADAFVADILNAISSETINVVVHPITNEVAINGYPGIAYMDSLNKSTSAGHPWNHSKLHHVVELDPDDVYQHKFTFDDVILARVAEIEASYLAGVAVSPVFTAHLKDEPLSEKKVNLGKVRVFSGAPLDWSIVVRKYTLSIVRLMMRNKRVFEMAPGIVAQSRQWHDLYAHLTQFGEDKLCNGDYANFDKTLFVSVLEKALYIMYKIAVASGNYSLQELRVFSCISTDICFALTNFDGDLVTFIATNPSGNPLTVIINSLVNSMLMRYCYLTLNPNGTVTDFKDNVVLLTYGDDNIFNSNQEWFNHTSVADALGEIGITYTMADKEAKSVPFIHMRDCSFLKRRWRFDSEIGHYMAELEEKSINKMFTVWVRSKCISEEEQAISSVQAGLREYFYYGREIYNQKRCMVMEIFMRANLMQYSLVNLPSYDELLDQYHSFKPDVALL